MAVPSTPPPRTIRFAPFELDIRAAELRKHGVRIRLHEQPFRILCMLLARPGEVVLREEIRRALWPNNTVVEFDHSINAAIQRLRDALGDSAGNQRYVETLPRRGYRFIAAVEAVEPSPVPVPPEQPVLVSPPADPSDLSGETFSHYRLIGKLGSGGMGVVYRAEDLKLGRQVALKFLPIPVEEATPQVLERFEREARAASALNHPNICTIHGVEEFAGQPVIVMELLEGETLAARLARGPVPTKEALLLAIQMATALESAHRKGIIHRDLKPANVMLTNSGVKLLDFGLAKMEKAIPAAEETATIATQDGVILGTWQYMSPEQAQGKVADERSDIFSFGLILYEMLSGRPAFQADSAAGIMAAILERDPAPLPDSVPPSLRRLILECLVKNPDERWHSAHDIRKELEWTAEPPLGASSPAPRSRRFPVAWLACAAFAIITAIALGHFWMNRPSPQQSVRFQIAPRDTLLSNSGAVLSPDGSRFVFTVDDGNGTRLLVWTLETGAATELPGTGSGRFPFWSPDGHAVGFMANAKLKTVSISGGDPVALSSVVNPQGGAWNRDGVILFAPNRNSALVRIPALGGGDPVPVTKLNLSNGEQGHAWPYFLPDNKHFLFTVYAADAANSGIFAGSLDSPEVIRVLPDRSGAQYAEPGHILFVRDGNLVAQPFDPGSLRVTGKESIVARDVSSSEIAPPFFSASAGLLTFRTGSVAPQRQLRWFDRRGNSIGEIGSVGRYWNPAISPDGRLLAIERQTGSFWDAWVVDLARGTNSRLTYGGMDHRGFTWSPDGSELAYYSRQGSHTAFYRIRTDGAGKPELVAQVDLPALVDQWTPDGKYLTFTRNPNGTHDIWAAPLSGGGKPFPLIEGPFDCRFSEVSPNGKWIAYVSTETGRAEVYVQSFPPGGGKWLISNGGGDGPHWRADGRELLYVRPTSPSSTFLAVPVKTDSAKFEAGTSTVLFDMPPGQRTWAFSPDAQKVLMPTVLEGDSSHQPFNVIVNWLAGVKR